MIIVHTHIGYGSPNMQDTYEAHGKPLGDDEVAKTKKNLGWPENETFYVPEKAASHFREAVANGKKVEEEWNDRFAKYREAYPDDAATLDRMIANELPDGWDADLPTFGPDDGKIATRAASQKIINALAPKIEGLIGGAADLAPSTKTAMKDFGDFEPAPGKNADEQGSAGGGWSWTGRNVHFGVREHAMGSIANGMAAHGGLRPFVATFLMFSDYMRPTIRLASLMQLPVTYIWTHDSIGLGEDGPTHQPVEHLASLRAIPDLVVLRPADATETVEAWKLAVESTDHPVALVFSRQGLPVLDRKTLGSAEGVRRGAYVLSESSSDKPDIILISTGSEVSLALDAQNDLEKQDIAVRVVSMPSWELFEQQSKSYQQSILPKDVTARLAIEAASPLGWHRWVGSDGDVLGVDSFGESAPGEKVLAEYGFTVEEIRKRAMRLLPEKEYSA
jgi:transketolase